MKTALFITAVPFLMCGCAHTKVEKILTPLVSSLEDHLKEAAMTASGPCGQRVIETYAVCKAQIEEAKAGGTEK